jgi:glucose-6-phosphate 1-dehydrogenase
MDEPIKITPAATPAEAAAGLEQPAPCAIVIFGAGGDLTKRLVVPALYNLSRTRKLPENFALIGVDLAEGTTETWQQHLYDMLKSFVGSTTAELEIGKIDEKAWKWLAGRMTYLTGDLTKPDLYARIETALEEAEKTHGTQGNAIFYLAVADRFFGTVVDHLGRASLVDEDEDGDGKPNFWRRVVIEKPFGSDLATAQELNELVGSVFPPESVFRIDHYLGKETVQNLLALRFANQLFEPIWNANYVDHVQITMAEDIGIGGRAGYYDGIGAARDVIQNHLLQLLALTAMEEPVSFEPRDLRIEKTKVLAAVQLPDDLAAATARGQYTAGWQGGTKVRGYTEEDGIPAHSDTETSAAVKLLVDTRRWAGVPFYRRAGKRLGRRVTEIAVVFKRAPRLPFARTDTEELGANALVIRVQPDEGTTIRFGSKVPGPTMEVRDVSMDFLYGQSFTESSPEAYERLILDVLLGVPSLFPQDEEVELSWEILDPIEQFWAGTGEQPDGYTAGTWGPASADAMMARDGRSWRRP